jgi:branched-subunit amino acid ABC-type transport system permease component
VQVFLQTLIGGITFGAVYALVAMGFSIVYRTMGLVNFAHGSVVMIGAYAASTFYMASRLPFAVAMVVAIVVTGLIGLIIERFLRPLENKDFTLMLIGTIGFGAVLEALAILIWGATGHAVPNPVATEPINLGGVRIPTYSLLVIGVAALATTMLAMFLRRTKVGAAMQAVAMDHEAATACGIHVGRSNALSFGRRGRQPDRPDALRQPDHGRHARHQGLRRGHAGRFRQHARCDRRRHGVRAAGCLCRRQLPGVLRTGHVRGLRAGCDGPADRHLRGGHGEPRVRRRLLYLVPAAVAAWLLPYGLGGYTMHVVDVAIIFAILAIGLGLTMGVAGQINLAQVAFFGVGAYTVAILTTQAGFGFWPAAVLAVVAAIVAGLLAGIPALRMQSHYLGIVTLGLALGFINWVTNAEIAGRAEGISDIPVPPLFGIDLSSGYLFYYLELVVFVLALAFALFVTRSPLGRRLRAMRDDDLAAGSLGAEIPLLRMTAFVLSGLYGGVAGVL